MLCASSWKKKHGNEVENAYDYANTISLEPVCKYVCVYVFVCACVCVRWWQGDFGLCWPSSGPATLLFQQFQAGNSCGEWGRGKSLHTAVEGYSAPLANINQIAWSWAFTGLENHIMLAHSHRHSLQHTVSLPGKYVATLIKVEVIIMDSIMCPQGIFSSMKKNLAT